MESTQMKKKHRIQINKLKDHFRSLLHSADSKLYYCDMLLAITEILQEHREYCEQSMKK